MKKSEIRLKSENLHPYMCVIHPYIVYGKGYVVIFSRDKTCQPPCMRLSAVYVGRDSVITQPCDLVDAWHSSLMAIPLTRRCVPAVLHAHDTVNGRNYTASIPAGSCILISVLYFCIILPYLGCGGCQINRCCLKSI